MKFILDRMLGSLARWLRIVGCDALYLREATDDALLALARAEGRVLLTRDGALAARAEKEGPPVLRVRSTARDEQLLEVAVRFSIPLEPRTERCSLCNAPLRAAGEGDREFITSCDYAPERLRGAPCSADFWLCTICGQLYWQGCHWRRIEERLAELRSKQSCINRVAFFTAENAEGAEVRKGGFSRLSAFSARSAVKRMHLFHRRERRERRDDAPRPLR